MHTKRQERRSPLIFYTKTTQELRNSCSRLSRGVKTGSTISNQNSSGSRWNGFIRYLQGRRNSRVLRQMERHDYSLLGWEGCYYCELRPLYCKTKESECSLSSISSHENNVGSVVLPWQHECSHNRDGPVLDDQYCRIHPTVLTSHHIIICLVLFSGGRGAGRVLGRHYTSDEALPNAVQ